MICVPPMKYYFFHKLSKKGAVAILSYVKIGFMLRLKLKNGCFMNGQDLTILSSMTFNGTMCTEKLWHC